MDFKILGLVCLLLINITYALMPADWYYGRDSYFTDGQTLALAGNKLFQPTVYINNPLSKILNKMQLSFGYNFCFLQERRTRQVFDQFDNTVGEVAFSENLFTDGKLGNISILYPLRVLNIGFNLSPINNFDYYFYQEFRDDFYAKVGEEELKIIGQIYNARFMVGKEFQNKFGVGVGLNYYFGTRKFSYHYQYGNNLINADTTGSPSGIGAIFGFSIMPSERILVHFDYQNSATFKKWLSDNSQKYPAHLNLAVAYLAGGEIPTQVGISGQYTNWHIVNNSYHNTFEVGIGVEHLMFSSVALRYGFRLQPSFVPPIVHQGAISFGWGFAIGKVNIDIAAAIKRRIINNENLIVPGNDNTIKIYQNTGDILISATIPIEKL
ncbi:MAG: hypothetical protein ABIK19_03255 [candidate division WOR-3 bacterium]